MVKDKIAVANKLWIANGPFLRKLQKDAETQNAGRLMDYYGVCVQLSRTEESAWTRAAEGIADAVECNTGFVLAVIDDLAKGGN
jgi:hypothetical protein